MFVVLQFTCVCCTAVYLCLVYCSLPVFSVLQFTCVYCTAVYLCLLYCSLPVFVVLQFTCVCCTAVYLCLLYCSLPAFIVLQFTCVARRTSSSVPYFVAMPCTKTLAITYKIPRIIDIYNMSYPALVLRWCDHN